MKAPKCKKCGKPLRDPRSIAAGMGPVCRGERGGGGMKSSRRASKKRIRRGHLPQPKGGRLWSTGEEEEGRPKRYIVRAPVDEALDFEGFAEVTRKEWEEAWEELEKKAKEWKGIMPERTPEGKIPDEPGEYRFEWVNSWSGPYVRILEIWEELELRTENPYREVKG